MLTQSFVGTDSAISKALAKAKEDGLVVSGDCAVKRRICAVGQHCQWRDLPREQL